MLIFNKIHQNLTILLMTYFFRKCYFFTIEYDFLKRKPVKMWIFYLDEVKTHRQDFKKFRDWYYRTENQCFTKRLSSKTGDMVLCVDMNRCHTFVWTFFIWAVVFFKSCRGFHGVMDIGFEPGFHGTTFH